jgi:serine/threonine protein kinase
MELVEGPTLADRIKKGPIPMEEAIAIARQIADGLAFAHDEGIVHRDLKPANIKIKPDGTVKVLDFGLAKVKGLPALDSEMSSTVTIGGTKPGVILGTAAYMSPEQARGQEVNKRADIWAFGVPLYEMSTGKRPFQGETVTDTLARVVRDVRFFLFSAIALDYLGLSSRFAKLFPVLLALDLLWAVSPFLLIHPISAGLALGLSALLVLSPFAHCSLILIQAAKLADR